MVLPDIQINVFFWDNLEIFADSILEPWLLVGDFNAIGSQKEKHGGQPFACFSKYGLSSFISDYGLVDLGFNGNPFTWNNGRQGAANIRKRLD